jgi:hypothetical protein
MGLEGGCASTSMGITALTFARKDTGVVNQWDTGFNCYNI